MSGKDNVNAVLTKESLEPIIGALLTHIGTFSDPPDPEKAKIADMLIQQGFVYLERKAGNNITLSHQRTIKEAIDLSGYLLQTIEGEPYHSQEKKNIVLKKYGLKTDTSVKLKVDAVETDDLSLLRRKLMQTEAKFSQFHFKQIFELVPEKIRPRSRKTFKAYGGVNNLFNLAYEFLAWKVHRALISAKLEPYLGFLHSEQFGKPSLVCDFQELYRYSIDDFVIQYCERLVKRDFTFKTEKMSAQKRGKREYLNDVETKDFTAKLNNYFEALVEIPRIKVGERQTIETLINEEALLFAKYLRSEKKDWIPRIGIID